MSEPDDYAAELHEARFRNAHPNWSERDYEEYFHPQQNTHEHDPSDEEEIQRHIQND